MKTEQRKENERKVWTCLGIGEEKHIKKEIWMTKKKMRIRMIWKDVKKMEDKKTK